MMYYTLTKSANHHLFGLRKISRDVRLKSAQERPAGRKFGDGHPAGLGKSKTALIQRGEVCQTDDRTYQHDTAPPRWHPVPGWSPGTGVLKSCLG